MHVCVFDMLPSVKRYKRKNERLARKCTNPFVWYNAFVSIDYIRLCEMSVTHTWRIRCMWYVLKIAILCYKLGQFGSWNSGDNNESRIMKSRKEKSSPGEHKAIILIILLLLKLFRIGIMSRCILLHIVLTILSVGWKVFNSQAIRSLLHRY